MDIEKLRNVVDIADAGGISPAALRLGVSTSIVSRRLVRLEAELGIELLSPKIRVLTDLPVEYFDRAPSAGGIAQYAT